MTITNTCGRPGSSPWVALPPHAPRFAASKTIRANSCSLLIFRVALFIMRLDPSRGAHTDDHDHTRNNAGAAARTLVGPGRPHHQRARPRARHHDPGHRPATLSAKLNATTDQLQWMSAAYTLALARFMLAAGVLGDRLGRKRMLLVGLVTFGISSVIASQMTSANGLIAMRAVMGISGAIVLPLM